jgi:hypothetical protein
MKGLVFTMLSGMVVTKFGYRVWDAAILNTVLKSNGDYVSTGTYADSELVGYVADLSNQTNILANELGFSFGEYVLGKFKDIQPFFFEGHTAFSFVKSVDSVIYVEVAKLHPDAVLPRFTYRDGEEGRPIMTYRSPRNLCALVKGLIAGIADIFYKAIDVAHPHCMLEGAETCVLELKFREPNE